MNKKKNLLYAGLIVCFSLVACSPSPAPGTVVLTSIPTPIVGPVKLLGQSQVVELEDTVETVWNCGEGGGTIMKHPAMAFSNEYFAEWSVGGQVGSGLTIGEGPLPVGVNLAGVLEGSYLRHVGDVFQRSTVWDLPAEPNTIVDYTISWREKWQAGEVSITFANQQIEIVKIRYRTGVMTDIKDKQVHTCLDNPSPTILPFIIDLPEPTPITVTVTPEMTLSPIPDPTPIVDSHGILVVPVPSGSFIMGISADVSYSMCLTMNVGFDCQRKWFEDAEPVHEVFVDYFYIDKYEITNSQYQNCVYAGSCSPPTPASSYGRTAYYGLPEFADYPVVNVDWFDAVNYCAWRGGRLPTEAEWEKAARGTEAALYPWGDDFDGTRLNFCDVNCDKSWANKAYNDGYFETSPVGSYRNGVSPYGAYDMLGNVWEWVSDWYASDSYTVSSQSNPKGPEFGVRRVIKGGGWDDATHLAAANRVDKLPTDRLPILGFRCVTSP